MIPGCAWQACIPSAGTFDGDSVEDPFVSRGSYLDPSYYRDRIIQDGLEIYLRVRIGRSKRTPVLLPPRPWSSSDYKSQHCRSTLSTRAELIGALKLIDENPSAVIRLLFISSIRELHLARRPHLRRGRRGRNPRALSKVLTPSMAFAANQWMVSVPGALGLRCIVQDAHSDV